MMYRMQSSFSVLYGFHWKNLPWFIYPGIDRYFGYINFGVTMNNATINNDMYGFPVRYMPTSWFARS